MRLSKVPKSDVTNVQTSRNFLYILPMARSSSDDSAINTLCISGFTDDVMFLHNGANGPESKTTLCFVEFVPSGCSGGEVAARDCRFVFVSVETSTVYVKLISD